MQPASGRSPSSRLLATATMRRRAGILTAVWLVCVVAATAGIVRGQAEQRDLLIERFESRAETGAGFVGSYVDDVFDQGERLIPQLAADAARPEEFVRTTGLMGFSAAVLLDGRGRALALAPAAPDLLGQPLAGRYRHLSEALAGRRTVSDVIPSAVEGQPIVAFALPLPGARSGVFSAGFSLEDSPLKAFLERQPIPGTRGYIVDSSGNPIVAAGSGVEADQLARSAASGEPIAGRVIASSPIHGTRWTYILDAPEDALLAPVYDGAHREWGLLVVLAVLGLGSLVVGGVALDSRAQARRDKAASDHRLRLTVEHAPIGMTMVGLDHRFIEPNRRLCEMLGYSADELAATTFDQVTDPADIDLDLTMLDQLIAGEIDHYELEKRYIRSDGTPLLGRLAVSVVRDERGAPLYFVSQIEDITEFQAARLELEYRALYDPLTGLANRSLLMDHLDLALLDAPAPGSFGLAFCDVDHFKHINDTHGHQVGDAVLREVAARLEVAVRPCDTVARMGGDEFVILLVGVDGIDRAELVLERVLQSLRTPIEVGDRTVLVGLSGGLAMSEPDDSADTILFRADAALYRAKRLGRGQFETHR